MSSFTTPLSYEPTGTFRNGRPEYRVTAPFRYEVGEIGSGLVLTVEEGFVTDLASVPWPFRRWFPPDGPWATAAAGHDRLYAGGVVSRRMADLIFLEAMEVLGVPPWRRWLMFLAVRVFGWLYFGRPGGALLISEEASNG